MSNKKVFFLFALLYLHSVIFAKPFNCKPEFQFFEFPIFFIKNEGQVNKKVKYYARIHNYTLWITEEGFVFDGGFKKDNSSRRSALKVMFLNRRKPEMRMGKLENCKINYFIGKDKGKWLKNIPTSKEVYYKGIYKNIDLKVYGNEREIEYDFEVKPKGRIEDIAFKIEGDGKIEVDNRGNLIIKTPFGKFTFRKPYTYQESEGKKREIKSEFVKIGKSIYGFKVGKYRRDKRLIIDPAIGFSTYFGGSNFESGYSIALDSSGNIYIAGITDSMDFPVQNAFDNTFNGGDRDIFITKLSPMGDSLLFSTYLGGSDLDEVEGMAIDSSGFIYITGTTYSSDFPAKNAFSSTFNGGACDVFLAKISPSGGGLVYSTYLGGNNEEVAYAIAVDSSGNAYLTGYTKSSDFPVRNGFQHSLNGNYDCFITTLSREGDSLLYSTYLGGSGYEMGQGIKLDSTKNVYITGTTSSSDFPTKNAFDNSFNGGLTDAFVVKLNLLQNSLVFSTYLGGRDADSSVDIAIDQSGYVYITGNTRSLDFPVKNAFDSTFNSEYNDYYGEYYYDSFIAKFNPDGNSLVFSTFLGGKYDDIVNDIEVDSSGCVYVVGATSSDNFPQKNIFQEKPGGYMPAGFIAKLNSSGNSLVYSTYLGGYNGEYANGIAIDSSNNTYVVGLTTSDNFPVFKGYSSTLNGEADCFITKFIETENTAKLNIKMRSNPEPVKIGEALTYTITITNAGPDSAPNTILIDDRMPPELQNPEYSLDGGATWEPWMGSVDLGTIPDGESKEVLLKGTVSYQGDYTVFNRVIVLAQANNSYHSAELFTNICANYRISVEVENGTTPTPEVVLCNPRMNTTVYFYPEEGFTIGELYIDGIPDYIQCRQTSYDFYHVKGDHHLRIVFIPSSNPVITSFTANPQTGLCPLETTFNCEICEEDRDSIVEYRWDFDGDGNYDKITTQANNIGTVYNKPGVYYPVVMVINNEGKETKSPPVKIKVGTKNTVCYYPSLFKSVFVEKDYLYLINDNPDPVNLTITYYNHNGEEVSEAAYSLSSFTKQVFSSEISAINDATMVKIEGDNEFTCFVRVDGEKDSAICQIGKNPYSTIYFPHIAEEDIWKTFITISNPYRKEVYVNNLELNNNMINVLTYGESKIATNPDGWVKVSACPSTPFKVSGFTKSLSSSNLYALSGSIYYFREDGKFSMVSDGTKFKHGYLAYIPTETEDFWYGYVITNVDTQSTNITLTFYSSNGQVVGEKQLTLEAGKKTKGLLKTDFPDISGLASWVEIHSNRFITAQSVYGSEKDMGGGICAFSASPKPGTTIIFPEASEEGMWTGISLVNTTNESTLVHIQLIEWHGEIKEERNMEIQPFSQFKQTLSSIFYEKTQKGFIRITSTKPIIGVMIKGNGNNTRLFGTTGKVY